MSDVNMESLLRMYDTPFYLLDSAKLHSRIDFLRLQFFCMKNYPLLLYSFSGRRSLAGYLRGFYFPVSCSDYFRFLAPAAPSFRKPEEKTVPSE